jgi:hypothetical protein
VRARQHAAPHYHPTQRYRNDHGTEREERLRAPDEHVEEKASLPIITFWKIRKSEKSLRW